MSALPEYLVELASVLIQCGYQHTCESTSGGVYCDACDAWSVWEAALAGKDEADARARIDALLLSGEYPSKLPAIQPSKSGAAT